MKTRCAWVTADQIYKDYHDNEWGVPLYDERALFEMLILEGVQAGLSWLTVLKRREAYRVAYDGFDPEIMACWTDEKIAELLGDATIIRNKLKVGAARKNAQAYLQIQAEHGSFSDFIWSFVGGSPIINTWQTHSEIPTSTVESTTMSKVLKKKGFTFVGPTICYAFMEAVGMVNDHLTGCYRYDELK